MTALTPLPLRLRLLLQGNTETVELKVAVRGCKTARGDQGAPRVNVERAAAQAGAREKAVSREAAAIAHWFSYREGNHIISMQQEQ
jgi:hypothetical protein